MGYSIKGLRRLNVGDGSPDSGALITRLVENAYATAIYSGDPVKLSAGYVCLAANTDKVLGVFKGCRYIDAQGGVAYSPYFPASTSSGGILEGETHVICEVDEITDGHFAIQVNAAVSQGNVGDLYTVDTSGGSSIYGVSGAVVDVSAGALTTSADAMVRLVGKQKVPGNDFGDTDMVGIFELVNPGYNA